jgi:hypothetical protein
MIMSALTVETASCHTVSNADTCWADGGTGSNASCCFRSDMERPGCTMLRDNRAGDSEHHRRPKSRRLKIYRRCGSNLLRSTALDDMITDPAHRLSRDHGTRARQSQN